MNEIQAEKRVILVFNTAIHMNAASRTGVALNSRGSIDDLKFVCVGGYAKVVSRHDRNQRKCRTFRLPALRTATVMIVCTIPLNLDRNRILIAFADKRSPPKSLGPRFHTAINSRVNRNRASHLRVLHFYAYK